MTPREAALVRLLRRLTGTVEIPCKDGTWDLYKVTEFRRASDELPMT